MENYIWIMLVVLSYLLALQLDILKRDKDSVNSPVRFQLSFFIKDNSLRLIVSFTLSLTLGIMYRIIFPDLAILNEDVELTKWGLGMYVAIGVAPDMVISYFKRKGDIFRLPEVGGYSRTVNKEKE